MNRKNYNKLINKIFLIVLISLWVSVGCSQGDRFLLCFHNGHALAGDAYYSICTNREPQDALLIGKVVKKENDNVLNIKILRVICGELKESQIKYYNPVAVKNTSVGKYHYNGFVIQVRL